MKQALVAFITAAIAVSAPAQSAKKLDLPPVGPWVVFGSKDPMTDQVSCTAMLGESLNVQYQSPRTLYVSMRGKGGIKLYQLRYDDAAAAALRGTSRRERDLSVIIIGGNSQDDPLPADTKRVRLQIFTLLGNQVVYDIDLSEADRLDAVMSSPPCR